MRPSLRSFSGFALAAAVAAGILSLSACGGGSSSATPTITSVSITPTAVTVPLNTQTDFTAVVNLSNSTTTTTTTTTSTVVTWQVNGVTGGNSTTGTIVSSPTDEQVGVYTAPLVVPTTNNGQVNITAIATQTNNSSSTSTTTITSNTAVVTIGTGLGLATSPTTAIVSAGSKKQFSATLNGLTDANATWSVSSAKGGSIGTIDPNSGVYTAPLYPPPGGAVTVTATDGANTATSTVDIIYSDGSLNGSY